MSDIECSTTRLEACFRRIHLERMQGIPLLNPALEVQAIGFTPWAGHCIGVLITPWFMNLMVMSGDGAEWEELELGAKVAYDFPSGSRQFRVNEVEDIGRCLTCALHSPMSCFPDQASAVARAEAVMRDLMDASLHVESSPEEERIAAFLRGEEMQAPEEEAEAEGAVATGQGQTIDEKLQQPVSRRDMLRGLFTS